MSPEEVIMVENIFYNNNKDPRNSDIFFILYLMYHKEIITASYEKSNALESELSNSQTWLEMCTWSHLEK